MDEMERAHRNDYEYEKKLREARTALRAVLDTERPTGRTNACLVDAFHVMGAEMDHIIARWN